MTYRLKLWNIVKLSDMPPAEGDIMVAIAEASRHSGDKCLEMMSTKMYEGRIRNCVVELIATPGVLDMWFFVVDLAHYLGDKDNKTLGDLINNGDYDEDLTEFGEFKGLISTLGIIPRVDLRVKIDPHTKMINLPGLITLMVRTNLAGARAFRRWITHDVIPAVMLYGRYVLQDESEKLIAKHKLELQEAELNLQKARNENIDLHKYIGEIKLEESELATMLNDDDKVVQRVLREMPSQTFKHNEFVEALNAVLEIGKKKIAFAREVTTSTITDVIQHYCSTDYEIIDSIIPQVGRAAKLFLKSISSEAVDLGNVNDAIRDKLLVIAFKCLYAKRLAPSRMISIARHQRILENETAIKNAEIAAKEVENEILKAKLREEVDGETETEDES